jgi:hypothetical protein
MTIAVIRSFHLIAAILTTGAFAAQAQTAAPAAKGWVDPGAVERAKSAEPAPPAAAAPATAAKSDARSDARSDAKTDTAKPADVKQSASDSEKLKELIRASEASLDADKAKKAAAAHAAHHARAVAHHASAPHVHAAPKRFAAKAVRHAASHPVAYDYLPSKKDGPVAPSSGPVSAAY